MSKNIEKTENRNAFLSGFIVLLGISALYFIYGPLELYANNIEDFAYDLGDLVSVMPLAAILAASFTAAVLAVLKRFNRRVWKTALIVLFVFFITSYIQGIFLSRDLPPMDGTPVSWKEFNFQRKYSIICIIILAIIMFFTIRHVGFEKVISIIKLASIALTAMILISSFLLIFSDGVTQDKPKQYASDEGLLEMSTEDNLVVFLVDAIDADAFREVYEYHPEFEELFKDFTFFPNTMAGYPYTSRAIPHILSGTWYENQGSFTDWCNGVFSSSELISKLKDDEYRLGFYCSEYNFAEALSDTFENLHIQQAEIDPLPFLLTQLKLSAYRFFPYDLKKAVMLTAEEVGTSTAAKQSDDEYKCLPEELEETFKKNDIFTSDQKQFKFIYTYGAHLPFEYESQSEMIDNYTYLSSVEKTMSVCAEYLSRLKESGVYDNSSIVILADHGYNGEESTGRQNPVLLIKGKNEKHSFTTSEKPVSHADIQAALLALEAGSDSLHAFSFGENDLRERRYLQYDYAGEEYLTEYIQTGYAADESSMFKTGTSYTRRDFQWFVDGVRNKIGDSAAD
ncbi:MAG: sulfatase-like hydrolase/transferase [Eubacteriales bacterium]|nr:sulfatase-like hydrolase/transferase [Eubacteriales bacterium]